MKNVSNTGTVLCKRLSHYSIICSPCLVLCLAGILSCLLLFSGCSSGEEEAQPLSNEALLQASEAREKDGLHYEYPATYDGRVYVSSLDKKIYWWESFPQDNTVQEDTLIYDPLEDPTFVTLWSAVSLPGKEAVEKIESIYKDRYPEMVVSEVDLSIDDAGMGRFAEKGYRVMIPMNDGEYDKYAKKEKGYFIYLDQEDEILTLLLQMLTTMSLIFSLHRRESGK